MNRMTDAEILKHLGTSSNLNEARKKFSSWTARIEQALSQATPISPIELRRMEFEAVEEIVAAYIDKS
jgi:hypothetical protein